MDSDTVESEITHLIVSSKSPAGPAETLVKEIMIDTSGILISAGSTDFAGLLANAGITGRGDVPLITGGSADILGAVMLNSSLGYCLDLDAVYNPATLHIAAALYPALLTLSVHTDSSGPDLIRAFNTGYDVAAAFGRAFSPSGMYARNFHPSSVCDAIGCAAASSLLTGLDDDEMKSALGLASVMASGLTTVFDEEKHHSAPFQVAHAARCGVEAALLAKAGIRGPQMFGRKNIMDTFSSGRSDEKAALLVETMEKGGSVLQTGFKRYPACKFLQTAIDGAMELRAAGVTADDIREITLSVAPSTAPLIDGAGDLTHNAQLILAAALTDGYVSGKQFATIRSNRRIVDLSRKVRVVADGQLERYYPDAMPALLELRLNSGEKRSTFVEYAKGDPAKPLSTAELISKFNTLAGGHPGAATIVESINSLPTAGETKHLLEMLCHR